MTDKAISESTRRNLVAAGWIVFVFAVANFALCLRIHEPLVHDSNGYFRAAKDIGAHGILSRFDLSWIRTYAYPLVLSWMDETAALLGLPVRVVATELQVTTYILSGLLLRRAVAVCPGGPPGIDIGMYLNVWAVFLCTEVLTDSLSLSFLLMVAACWLFALQNIQNRKYWIFLSVGSLLVGFCVMLRPANVFMLAAWIAGHLLLIFRDRGMAVTVKVRAVLLRPAMAMGIALLPMLPQLRNNVVYYGRWTPLVAARLQKTQFMLGAYYIKYATAVPPVPIVSVQYRNPFFAGTSLPDPYPSVWYAEHPVRGAATIGLHVFDLIDQDFPFVYVRSLLPWYRLPEAVALHFLVGLSLLGLLAWLKPLFHAASRESGEAITMRAAFLFAAGAYIAVYCFSAPESRFGVPLLWAVLPFSLVAVRRVISNERKQQWAKLSLVLVYAALAVRLSVWVTAQAPAIAAARNPSSTAPANPSRRDYGPLSISPKSGSGLEQVFQVTATRTARNPPPPMIGLLINNRLDGGGACYVFWNFISRDASLVNDTGSGTKILGKADSIANRQCELLREGSTILEGGSQVSARFHLRFRGNFAGPQKLFVIPQGTDGTGPGLIQVGTWIVPGK